MKSSENAKKHSEKDMYVRTSRGVLEATSGDLYADGKRLAERCLNGLQCLDGVEGGQENFPPKLLILMATVGFQGSENRPFNDLVAGVQERMKEELKECDLPEVPPLIGCSVASVITEKQMMPDGVALVCLASRFIKAKVVVGRNASEHTNRAVADICKELNLTSEDANLHSNRFLLCFLPGFREIEGKIIYRASEIHAELRAATDAKIPMVGGVAGDKLKRKLSWQFADGEVYVDGAVVALVESDVRFGIAMGLGLDKADEYLFAKDVTNDGHQIAKFARWREDKLQTKTAKDVLDEFEENGKMVLLGGVTPDDETERVVLYPQALPDGSVFVSRPVIEEWPIAVLPVDPQRLRATAGETIDRARRRGQIDPFHLSCMLGFVCAARYEYYAKIGLDGSEIVKELQAAYPGVPIVGACMFGEIGLGPLGRPLMRNWMLSGLLISDELMPACAQRIGNRKLAELGKRMAAAESVEEVLSLAMDAVIEIGFPGGMISLIFQDCLRNGKSYVIKAMKARESSWRLIIERTTRRPKERDLLVVVAEERKPRFVRDSRIGGRSRVSTFPQESGCDCPIKAAWIPRVAGPPTMNYSSLLRLWRLVSQSKRSASQN